MNEIYRVIIQRANERRDRAAQRATNPDAVRASVPFAEWLHFVHQINDPMELKPYRRWCLFCDYEIDCVRYNLEPEHPARYGLYNTLYRHD